MRIEITGGAGMTREQFDLIRARLTEFFEERYYGGAYDVMEASLDEHGMKVVARGRQPIIGELTDKIDEILIENGFGLGYGEDQILMALFP